MKTEKAEFLYFGAGLMLLLVGGNFVTRYPGEDSVVEILPEFPGFDPDTAHAEIAELKMAGILSKENISRGEDFCRFPNPTDYARRICLLQQVHRTWSFTDPFCGIRYMDYRGENDRPNPDPTTTIAPEIINSASLRILNGTVEPSSRDALHGEYPWVIIMLRLQANHSLGHQKAINEADYFCGGSLISPTRGLTAAHCCVYLYLWPTRIRLHIGHYENRDLTACVMHPDYVYGKRPGTPCDVGDLKWIDPIGIKTAFNGMGRAVIVVNTVCLPPAQFSADQIYHSWQELAGSGAIFPNIPPAVPLKLQRVPFWISPTNEAICGRYEITANKVRGWPDEPYYFHCRAQNNNASSCKGDSGSPMTRVGVPALDGGTPVETMRSYQVGLVSRGLKEMGAPCHQKFGTLFQNVTYFQDFILTHVLD